MRKDYKLFALATVFGLAATSFGQVTSTFNATAEGWTRVEFASPSSFGATGSVTFNASNGNPGGAVSIADVEGTFFCFGAPAAYHGDRSGFLGGEISWDLLSSPTSLNFNTMPFAAAISGPAGTIYSAHPNRPYSEWQRFRLVVSGNRDWRWNSTTGPVATPAQVESVLVNVNRIALMGDYRNGTDTARLDNVYFGPARVPTTDHLAFDASAQGVAQHRAVSEDYTGMPFNPVLATWGASAGVSGGGLTVGDPDADTTWFLVPGSMMGDRSSGIGGAFSFDLKTTNSAGNSLRAPLVTVTSGGRTLVYAPEELDGYTTGNVWAQVSIPWETSPGWRVGTMAGRQPTSEEFVDIAGNPEFMRVRAEYWVGDETNTFDNLRFEAPVLTTVTGRVDLGGDFVGDPTGVEVQVTAYRDGFPLETQTTLLDAEGDYEVTMSVAGEIVLAVKPRHWLRAKTTARTLNGGSVGYDPVSPVNGDVDGDNAITVFDYDRLSAAFDTSDGATGWDPAADLDGDGTVSVFDYDILSRNFDQVGD